jgi:parvulin-like peptidyl-prolyl isomerase
VIGRTRTALAAIAVVALAGCGDSPRNDSAAEVGGAVVSRDQYEQLLTAIVANPEVFGIEEESATGTVEGDAGRSILEAMILDVAGKEYLAEQGESITDADRQIAIETIGPQVDTWPADVANLIVDRQAGVIAFGRVAASSGETQARYESSPADLAVLCVRHILVETEEEAEVVLQELADGADFAELAAEQSIEPAAAETGGALEAQPGQPCIPLQQAEAGLDATFLAAATGAVPGTPVGPVETQFGWHVILARPYDEVTSAVDSAVGQQLLQEHLATTDIEVDPRYGRWDAVEGTVVSL